jgi:hypothetical protein
VLVPTTVLSAPATVVRTTAVLGSIPGPGIRHIVPEGAPASGESTLTFTPISSGEQGKVNERASEQTQGDSTHGLALGAHAVLSTHP